MKNLLLPASIRNFALSLSAQDIFPITGYPGIGSTSPSKKISETTEINQRDISPGEPT
jgi:hypothetical protein